MPSLFDGVQSFTPAFTGQQLAIEVGARGGSNFSQGMSAGKGTQGMGFDKSKLDSMMRGVSGAASGSSDWIPTSDWTL